MSKDLRKRKDEKFVRFAKEYQKKREDSRETWEQQPSNAADVTSSGIVKRIQLLLPAEGNKLKKNMKKEGECSDGSRFSLWQLL